MKIFITGVSAGIGRELAKQFINEGNVVWGVARRREMLEELKSELKSDKFFYSVCDLSRQEDILRVYGEMAARNFLPDVIVLNAAVLKEDLVPDYNYEFFREMISVNVLGALKWVDLFIGKFSERKSGQFIAISSIAAFRPDPLRAGYPASKSALTMAFRSLRLRYQKDSVFFKIVFLGPVATAMSVHRKFLAADPKRAADFIARAILRRGHKYYFPIFATFLFRVTLFFPDTVFSFLSSLLKKK